MPPVRDYSRLDLFLDRLETDVYPEVPNEPHLSITRDAITRLHGQGWIKAGDRVLDIGCGQGLALELFRDIGAVATGISLGSDVEVCRAKGLDAAAMDQNFMTFDDGVFDVLWCRHVLEHSVAPLYTLSEYRRVTKPGGRIYIEVPAPDTTAHHEQGPNHYSILPRSSWIRLFQRAGCRVEQADKINFTVPCGPDEYWAFHLRV